MHRGHRSCCRNRRRCINGMLHSLPFYPVNMMGLLEQTEPVSRVIPSEGVMGKGNSQMTRSTTYHYHQLPSEGTRNLEVW